MSEGAASHPDRLDAVVIGGGFYGTTIAIYLASQRGMRRVVVVEKESAILTHASYNNQARVHNGYHYPRSFTTAYRSRINLPRFARDWPEAVKRDFTKLYAIARRNSKVTARQFERFCHEIGAPVRPATPAQQGLFDERLVEGVFQVDEFAFDSTRLARWALGELQAHDVALRLDTRVREVRRSPGGALNVVVERAGHGEQTLETKYLFNCTYSGLNQLRGEFPGTTTGLKHEITEMALMQMPPELQDIGITVMDGPFFSTMPFPARRLHTLSHVRYTPHASWLDQADVDPYRLLDDHHRHTRVDRMVRDSARYVPAIARARRVDSLYEVKTVLVKNESDDGRPILFEKHLSLPGCYSILGGKIDNVYDVIERMDSEQF
jgi:glycine/D-amino acid oxidase-like deaminating enzyme